MVTSVTGLSARSGLHDWLYQRISAVILGVYSIFIFCFFLKNPAMSFTQWSQLFDALWMKIFTFFALFFLLIHVWIGLWSVSTDYLNDRALGPKSIWIRLPIQITYSLTLVVYTIWGTCILWSF